MILQARITLERFKDSARNADREEIIAYAVLDAYCSHFPNKAAPIDRELLSLTKRIFESEKDRFFKQRRIALSQLAQQLKE